MSVLGTIAKGAMNFLGSGSGIGTLINAGVGILGNLLGNNSQQEANKANMQISQMNNQFNERMLEKQMRYNSAQQQVERFKDAGLNPALMMQGQSAGQASNTTASPTPPMQAYRPDFSSIGSSIEAAIQRNRENEMLAEQIKGVRIENQYKRQKIIQELANMKEQELSTKAKRRLDEITSTNLDNMQTEEYLLNRERRADLKSQVEKRTKEMLLLDKEIFNFDARWDAEKAHMVSQTLLNGAMTGRTKQEMRSEVYNTIKKQYESQYQKIDARTLARMADYIVNKAHTEQWHKNPFSMIMEYFGSN